MQLGEYLLAPITQLNPAVEISIPFTFLPEDFCVLQVNRLGLDIQIDYFNITRKQFDQLLGPSKARDYMMKRSFFSITIGANDFLNNYLLPVLSIGARISESPSAFVDDMISHFRNQLTVRDLNCR